MADADEKPLPPLPPPGHGEHQYGPTGAGPHIPITVPMDHLEHCEYADDGEFYGTDANGTVVYGGDYGFMGYRDDYGFMGYRDDYGFMGYEDDHGSVDYGSECERLSTISERTEISEYSTHYPSARQVAYPDSISSGTEYSTHCPYAGQVADTLLPPTAGDAGADRDEIDADGDGVDTNSDEVDADSDGAGPTTGNHLDNLGGRDSDEL